MNWFENLDCEELKGKIKREYNDNQNGADDDDDKIEGRKNHLHQLQLSNNSSICVINRNTAVWREERRSSVLNNRQADRNSLSIYLIIHLYNILFSSFIGIIIS